MNQRVDLQSWKQNKSQFYINFKFLFINQHNIQEYNQQMLKIFLTIVCLLFHLNSATDPLAGILINRSNQSIDSDCLQILHQDSRWAFPYFYIHVYSQQGKYDESQTQAIKDSQKAGFKLMAKFQLCLTKDPIQQATQFVSRTNINVFDIIWLGADQHQILNCSWVNLKPQQACSYLKNLILFFQNRGKDVGIVSSFDSWNTNLGSTFACPELGNLPLWLSQGQFKPFGGWNKYAISQKFNQLKNYCPGRTATFVYELKSFSP